MMSVADSVDAKIKNIKYKICDYLHHVIRSIYRGRPQEEEF